VIYVAPAVPANPAVWVEVAYTAQPIRIPNTGAAVGGEEFKAKLNPTDMVFDLGDNVAGLFEFGGVDGDIDSTGHDTPGGTAIGAAEGGIAPGVGGSTGVGSSIARVSANWRSTCVNLRCRDQRVA
jgi:hypothetical protein